MSRAAERDQLLAALRRHGIRDERVLAAMAQVPREAFVTDALQAEAYDDEALPIACGQTISQPFVVAYMTERLDVQPQHRVLEVGTGSGYQAAILSRLAGGVCTVERHAALAAAAAARFRALGLDNIETRVGDGSRGWPEGGSFDRIIVTAAAKELPQALLDQLAEGGVMVAPEGASVFSQHLWRLTRAKGKVRRERLIGVRFVPLVEDGPGSA